MMNNRVATATWVCGIIVFLLSGMCAYGHPPTDLRITVDPEPTYVGRLTQFRGDAKHGNEDLGEGEANWAWDFGDGTGGNGKVVQHGYGAAGTYTVRLTVTVGGDSASTTTPVRVKQLGIQMEPCPYSWLPRNGNTVSLSATIKERMPGEAWQTSTQERIITFTLSNVSHQPGVCMNWGGQMGPDLTLEADQNPNYNVPDDMTAIRNSPTNRGTIVVSSWDYGGWGYLEATAPMCVQIGAPNRNRPEVEIPYDLVPAPPNANRVADGWIGDPYWDESMAWDQDTTPQGNGTNGDALTMYEEYRGFIIGGAHSRGASWVDAKQVFIRSTVGLGLRSILRLMVSRSMP